MADDETYDEAVKAFVVIKEWMETAKQLDREIPELKSKLLYV